MKKLASSIRRGDKILVDGAQHVVTAPAMVTGSGVTLASVPNEDRDADDTLTELGHNHDVEVWG
jgi:hypothetical protein